MIGEEINNLQDIRENLKMNQSQTTISGNIVDVKNSRIYGGTIIVKNGIISEISPDDNSYDTYILPGLIDSHIHIESSMLIPSQFARAVAGHGTVAVVSDPHEIANVIGIDGVRFMIADAKNTPLQFYFGVPSCVPASQYETNGATIGPDEVELLFKTERLKFMGEIMNVPGVLNEDPLLQEKMTIAKKYAAILDGHAPGLNGFALQKYCDAGITTDHEAVSYAEALEKIKAGMKIQIREGSAAQDFDQLHYLIDQYPDQIMFCSDDKHPDALIDGHIDLLVKRALQLGHNLYNVLRAATVNPITHYHLDIGLIQPGDWADFIVVNNLSDFQVLKTYLRGNLVAENGSARFAPPASQQINHFRATLKQPDDFKIRYRHHPVKVIEITDGKLITGDYQFTPKNDGEFIQADLDRDIIKITVINRYQDSRPVVGFIKNFGLKKGAIASSVAHDSHNIIAVGVDDQSISTAVNLVIKNQGGISAVSDLTQHVLPLPVGGIMSDADFTEVASQYQKLNTLVKIMGSTLKAPFMTLSFMTLLVIPKLKISDRGLFDGEKFELTGLFSNN